MASQPQSFSPDQQRILETAGIHFANGELPARHPSLGPVAEKCTGDDAFDAIHAPNAFAKELKLRKEVAEYRRSIGLDAPEPEPDTWQPATQRGLAHDAGRGWVPATRDIGLAEDRAPRQPLQQDDIWDPNLSEEENDHNWRYTQWRAAEARAQAAFAALWPGLDTADTNQLTPERQVQFLSVLATNGNVRAACAAVGTSAHTAYKLRRRNPLFARGWAGALAAARVHVDAVIHDRALNGIEEPVLYRGEVVATRRRYDNRLLLALAGRLDKAAEDPRVAADEAGLDALLAAIAGDAPTPAHTPRATWCADAAARASAAWEQEQDAAVEEPEDAEIAAMQAARLARAAALASAREAAGAEWDAAAATLHARMDGLTAGDQGRGRGNRLAGGEGAEIGPPAQCNPCHPRRRHPMHGINRARHRDGTQDHTNVGGRKGRAPAPPPALSCSAAPAARARHPGCAGRSARPRRC